MTQEEEKIILLAHRNKLSFAATSKLLKRRSEPWVRCQYRRLYAKNLKILRQVLSNKLQNDEIATLIKNGRISPENFVHFAEGLKKSLTESLRFIQDDRHGQIQKAYERNHKKAKRDL